MEVNIPEKLESKPLAWQKRPVSLSKSFGREKKNLHGPTFVPLGSSMSKLRRTKMVCSHRGNSIITIREALGLKRRMKFRIEKFSFTAWTLRCVRALTGV